VVADVGKLAPAELAAGNGTGHAAGDNPHT